MEVSCEANSEPGASKQQNLGGVVISRSVSIFVEGDFQNPMDLVFDTPIIMPGLQDLPGVLFQIGDRVCKGKPNLMKWNAKIYAKWGT
jgi:hypothetical protein